MKARRTRQNLQSKQGSQKNECESEEREENLEQRILEGFRFR